MLDKMNIEKIKENIPALANGVTYEGRAAIRKLLNGLGFRSEQYIREGLGLPEYNSIWNALIESQSGVLNSFLHCTIDESQEAIKRFHSVKGTTPAVATTPAPETPATPVKTSETPKPKATPKATDDKALQIAMLLKELTGDSVAPLDETRVIELINQHAKTTPASKVEIVTNGESKTVETGLQHYLFPTLFKMLHAKESNGFPLNVALVGPAGSGKTHICKQIAETMGLNFYFNGKIETEYKLSGYVDAKGERVRTQFTDFCTDQSENGALYLFDEMDRSNGNALTAINAYLANGMCDLPGLGKVLRTSRHYIVAGMNTYGLGASGAYSSANKLCESSRSRFVFLNFPYDEKLEFSLASNDNWTRKIQAIRRAKESHKLAYDVTPRHSIAGAALLAVGISENEVLNMTVFAGWKTEEIQKVKASANI